MKTIGKYIEDILIISGLILVAVATFSISTIAGLYCVGASLLGLGIWFAKHPVGRE